MYLKIETLDICYYLHADTLTLKVKCLYKGLQASILKVTSDLIFNGLT